MNNGVKNSLVWTINEYSNCCNFINTRPYAPYNLHTRSK